MSEKLKGWPELQRWAKEDLAPLQTQPRPSSQHILPAIVQSRQTEIVADWADEASEAAVGCKQPDGSVLVGNPRRAGYIEFMARRCFG